MARKILLFAIVSVPVILMFCAVSFKLLTDGCIWFFCTPERNISVYELDIPDTFFPSNSIINELLPVSEPMGAEEAINKTVYWGDYGIAVYNIWNYKSERRASSLFNALKNDASRFKPHDNVNYISQTSDEFFSGCGYLQLGGYRCGAFIRYEGLTISLSARIDSQMTEKQFNEIIQYIDEELAQLFE
ncbi:MAG: hypothetical protein IT327_31940 [Anaerolineae bacterium]|nr:hypothetical protein [Anaerolineae bacterium]